MAHGSSTFGGVWISSYSKSGTTWLRFLLTGLSDSPPERSAQVDDAVPCVHEPGVTSAALAGRFLHTHLRRDRAVARFGAGSAFVHIVRHPLDVLWSHVNYFVLTQLGHYERRFGPTEEAALPDATAKLASHYVAEYLSNGGDAHGRSIGYGTWNEHADGWFAAMGEQPGLRLRYEDLRRDPHREAHRLAAFLRLPCSEQAVRAAVEGASFARMKQMEAHEIAAEVPGRFYRAHYAAGLDAGLRFLHRGRVGLGAKHLPPAVIDRVAALHQRTMTRLGYAIVDGKAVVEPQPDQTL